MIRQLVIPLIGLFLALAPPIPAQEISGPVAAPLQPVQDVGEVQQGRKLRVSFAIRNDGDAELALTEVKPSCGCTVVEFDRRIAPGASGAIKAVIETANFRGPIAKSVTVYTNDTENPRIVLVVKADVRTPLEASPSYARFLTVTGEPVEKQVITVWASDLDDFQIRRVESPFDFLEVQHRLANEDEEVAQGQGRQWRLELVLDPKAPVGPLADRIRLQTNHPRQKLMEIPVSGFVRPVLGVNPPQADFGHRPTSDPFETSLEIINYAERDIEVRGVQSDIAAIRAELEPLDEGRRYQVRLTLQPGLPKGEFSGTLRIRTSDPSRPVLEVPLKGTIL